MEDRSLPIRPASRLRGACGPLLYEPWVPGIDTTVKTVAGKPVLRRLKLLDHLGASTYQLQQKTVVVPDLPRTKL